MPTASLILTACVERWPVAGAFIISRGAKTHVDVVVVTVSDGHLTGRGEGTPIYYHGESAEDCVAAVAKRGASNDPITRTSLLNTMAAGAARNALDCALWDLESQREGASIWQLAGLPEPQPLVSAFTISLGEPQAMEADARARADLPLLKLKLAGEGDHERVAAVRRGAPKARLIVDANESWTGRDIAAEAAALAAFGVEMVEQPVKAGEDHLLDGVQSPIPLVADESCQTRVDLTRLAGRYQGVNIKLDKTGGLTEAMALASEARTMGFDVMIGCMLGTSLGIAPAFLLGAGARWVDLDGALLLARDRSDPFIFEGGQLSPPPPRGRDGD